MWWASSNTVSWNKLFFCGLLCIQLARTDDDFHLGEIQSTMKIISFLSQLMKLSIVDSHRVVGFRGNFFTIFAPYCFDRQWWWFDDTLAGALEAQNCHLPTYWSWCWCLQAFFVLPSNIREIHNDRLKHRARAIYFFIIISGDRFVRSLFLLPTSTLNNYRIQQQFFCFCCNFASFACAKVDAKEMDERGENRRRKKNQNQPDASQVKVSSRRRLRRHRVREKIGVMCLPLKIAPAVNKKKRAQCAIQRFIMDQ